MKRSKHGLFVFPPKKTLIWRRHCSISWPIVLQYDIKAISRMFSGMKFFRRSVRLTNQSYARLYPFNNQSNRSISVCLLFLFCKVIRKLLYKYGNSRLRTLKTIPCSSVHTRLGQISPPQMKIYHLPGQLFLRLLNTSLKHKLVTLVPSIYPVFLSMLLPDTRYSAEFYVPSYISSAPVPYPCWKQRGFI